MEQALVNFQNAVTDVKSRIENIIWRLTNFENGVVSLRKGQNSVKVMKLIFNVETVKDEYELLQQQIADLHDAHKYLRCELTEEVSQVFDTMVDVRKSFTRQD